MMARDNAGLDAATCARTIGGTSPRESQTPSYVRQDSRPRGRRRPRVREDWRRAVGWVQTGDGFQAGMVR